MILQMPSRMIGVPNLLLKWERNTAKRKRHCHFCHTDILKDDTCYRFKKLHKDEEKKIAYNQFKNSCILCYKIGLKVAVDLMRKEATYIRRYVKKNTGPGNRRKMREILRTHTPIHEDNDVLPF